MYIPPAINTSGGMNLVPIYRYRGHYNMRVGNMTRGKDRRDIVACERDKKQQLKSRDKLITHRPYN